MNSISPPITHDLVFIGGGHSHAIALRKWAMNPISGVQVTLITDVVDTPYSGMLPGYVAGLYTFDECHIDLRPLCQLARVRMIVDQAVGLDLQRNRVLCANHPAIAFDTLSIDIGSTPAAMTVPGAMEYAVPVKPISRYLAQWESLLQEVRQTLPVPFRLGIVGGGAGGVELALSAQAHLQSIYQKAGKSAARPVEIHLFQRGAEVLPERHPRMRRLFHRLMVHRGIHLHVGEAVMAIRPGPSRALQGETRQVQCESGLTVTCDRVFWVTQASAASWIRDSELATQKQGFIQVNDCLQSISHPQVFAAGDIATMINHPRPKAGVFAVRQGQPLYENLRRAILKQPLHSFKPQAQFLILVGTGYETAVASRGFLTLGPWSLLWRWKDSIDRKFMDQFSNLRPPMSPSPSSLLPSSSPSMYCSGCASKVGSSVLNRTFARLHQEHAEWFQKSDVVLGLEAPDDAAAIAIPAHTTLIQTLDAFKAIVDDPFIFGQIAAHHSLSDLFAMGVEPHSALAIASLPYATAPKLEETLYHLLSGALKVLHQAQAVLIGGHTVEGADLSLGFSCNGFAPSGHLLRKSGMHPGDVLILTKALGIGTLFAAHMQLKAKGRWIEEAIATMLQSNQEAAITFRHHRATACTDVTGFGLLGHLLEMVRPSGVAVELELDAIPVLSGVPEITQQAIVSSLYPQNVQAAASIENQAKVSQHPLFPILFDPQTSGGLLASVPTSTATTCLQQLKTLGYRQSAIIGRVIPALSSHQPVRIVGVPSDRVARIRR